MLPSNMATRPVKRSRNTTGTDTTHETHNNYAGQHKSKSAVASTSSIRIFALIALACISVSFAFFAWNKTKLDADDFHVNVAQPLQAPSLVVVASINGGTSAINAIILWHFKRFFHGIKALKDGYYWIDCVPEDYTQFGIKQVPNKAVSVSNITARATDWTHWNYAFEHLKWRGCKAPRCYEHRCSHPEYMQWIGFDHRTQSTPFDHVLRDDAEYQAHRKTDERWPDEPYRETVYFWERTSGYNGPPHVAMILAANFPSTKLLYMVRDPLIQAYSRVRHFDEHTHLQKADKNNMSAVEANRRFGKILQFLQGDEFSVAFNLLKSADTAHNEDAIVMWYMTVFARLGIRWKDERIFDLCPVINLLVFVRPQQHFNQHADNVRVMQFEQMASGSDGLIRNSVALQCWVMAADRQQSNACFAKYASNDDSALDDIMWNWRDFQNNPHYGKLQDYDVRLSDSKTVDAILEVFGVCDQRLLGLFRKYPILMGEFDMALWAEQRRDFKEKVRRKSIP